MLVQLLGSYNDIVLLYQSTKSKQYSCFIRLTGSDFLAYSNAKLIIYSVQSSSVDFIMKERLNLYFFRPTSAVLLDNQHASILEVMPGRYAFLTVRKRVPVVKHMMMIMYYLTCRL